MNLNAELLYEIESILYDAIETHYCDLCGVMIEGRDDAARKIVQLLKEKALIK